MLELRPYNEEEIYKALIQAKAENKKVGIRGLGRHLRRELNCDLVISTLNLNNFEIKGNKLLTEAGASVEKIREEALSKDFILPTIYDGTIGGLLALNEFSTLSTAYGTPWDFSESVDFITPLGKIRWRLVIGSQGILGVITRAEMKLYKKPEKVFLYEKEIKDKEEFRERIKKLISLKPLALLVEYDGSEKVFRLHSSYIAEHDLRGYIKDEGVPIISEESDKNSYIVEISDFVNDIISIINNVSPYYLYGIYGVNLIKVYVTDESLLKEYKYYPKNQPHPLYYKFKRIFDFYDIFN